MRSSAMVSTVARIVDDEAGSPRLASCLRFLQHLGREIVVAFVVCAPYAGDPLIAIGSHRLFDPHTRAATVPQLHDVPDVKCHVSLPEIVLSNPRAARRGRINAAAGSPCKRRAC